MTETELLLDSLRGDMPELVSSLFDDPSLRTESVEWLNGLFKDENVLTDEGLVMEIAELDAAQSKLEDKIKKTVVGSSRDIIESRLQLDAVVKGTASDFKLQIKEVSDALEADLSSVTALKALGEQTPLAVILGSSDSISSILELPALVAACVKAGYYHETLELSAHARRLAIRFPDLTLIKEVENAVKAEVATMLVGLLRLLRTDLKQSHIVKIVSYLRRIYPFNSLGKGYSINDSTIGPVSILQPDANSVLRRVYFDARREFIISELNLLQPLKKHSTEKYLKRVNELIREHCFTSILTYQSLFPTSSSGDDDFDDAYSENDLLIRDFVYQVISHFVDLLKDNLPSIKDQQARDSLILQIMYCSQSLGRVHAEFGGIITDKLQIFGSSEKAVISESEWLRVLKKQRTLMKNLNNL